MLKINLNSEWATVRKRYAKVKVQNIIDTGLALWGADLMVKEAKSNIDKLVYDAPLPPSAQGNEGYLDHARTRRTRKAIKRIRMTKGLPHNARGFEAFVDKSDYVGYYYASILNFGGKPGGRMANYKPRPFWTNAATIVKAQFHKRGLTVLAEMKHALETD